METVFFLLGVTSLVVVNTLLAFVLGWLLTEIVRLPLNFKPFTCRPCLTFWFTAILGVMLALIVAPYFPGVEIPEVRTAVTFGLIGVGVLMGFINFLYVKLKFRIYD